MKINLVELIQNRRWERHDHPFPYIYARGVFKDDFYKSLEYEYQNMLQKGLSEQANGSVFSRNMTGYDAYGMSFNFIDTSGSLSIFLSPQWHSMMNSLFGLRGTGHINCGAHHHAVGSKDGFIHNDLNPVWFPVEGEGPIRLPGANCSYKTGAGPLKDNEKIEVVRSVVMIYYIANPPWQEGDGGETGLYTTSQANVSRPDRKIPPHNNSLVIYECTPNSWHTFISNKKSPRSSIIMWTHKPMEEAIEKWGADSLEYWKI